MVMKLSLTKARADLYKIVDRVLETSTAFRNYGNVFCQPRSGVRE